MGLPRRSKPSTDLTPPDTGKVRQAQLLARTDQKSTYLPPSIALEDLDRAVFDCLENGALKLTVKEDVAQRSVPVFFLTMERWAEVEKTWKYYDRDQQVLCPFITLKREGKPQPGTHPGVRYLVPNRKLFTYRRVPRFSDGRFLHYDVYKIPQPTAVDVTYQVRLFSRFLQHTNQFDQLLLNAFASRQLYVDAKGHYLPMVNESISDESQLEEVDGENIMISTYELRLMGYMLDEKDFQVVQTVKKVGTTIGFY